MTAGQVNEGLANHFARIGKKRSTWLDRPALYPPHYHAQCFGFKVISRPGQITFFLGVRQR